MASYEIIYWRSIPTQITLKKSRREQYKRELPQRFINAVDMAAVKANITDDDGYLQEWVKGDAIPIPEADNADFNFDQFADKLLTDLEANYPNNRLKSLIDNGGHE